MIWVFAVIINAVSVVVSLAAYEMNNSVGHLVFGGLALAMLVALIVMPRHRV